jgi:hypothetical protein
VIYLNQGFVLEIRGGKQVLVLRENWAGTMIGIESYRMYQMPKWIGIKFDSRLVWSNK